MNIKIEKLRVLVDYLGSPKKNEQTQMKMERTLVNVLEFDFFDIGSREAI